MVSLLRAQSLELTLQCGFLCSEQPEEKVENLRILEDQDPRFFYRKPTAEKIFCFESLKYEGGYGSPLRERSNMSITLITFAIYKFRLLFTTFTIYYSQLPFSIYNFRFPNKNEKKFRDYLNL